MSEAKSNIETHVDPVEYDASREPDEQYNELLRRIILTGNAALSGMDDASREVLGHQMRFDLSDGFPLITERNIMRGSTPEIIANYESDPSHHELTGATRQALGEIIGFVNGARTQEELESFGCKNFWLPWTTNEEKAAKRGLEVGDLGPGSYGAAFHDFPMPGGETFDQYEALIEQIRSRPELRAHIISPFIPYYISRAPGLQQKALIVPCHGMQHFNVDVENKEMSLVHWQRSADVPIGLPYNMVHYGALLMMVAQVTGYKPKELVYQVSNAHIYEQHVEKATELVARQPFPFPKLKLDPSVKELKDFRVEHFSVEEYEAHPPMAMGDVSV